MGYYVKTESVDFRIPSIHIPAAFEALCKMNGPEYDNLKNGGSWTGGKQTAKWYSWMSADYHLKCKSVKDVFDEVGFEGSTEDGLGFVLGSYDQKAGQEALFLEVVAKFALPGKIRWQGEDGARWEQRFELGKVTTHDLTSLVWSDDLEDFLPPFLQNS